MAERHVIVSACSQYLWGGVLKGGTASQYHYGNVYYHSYISCIVAIWPSFIPSSVVVRTIQYIEWDSMSHLRIQLYIKTGSVYTSMSICKQQITYSVLLVCLVCHWWAPRVVNNALLTALYDQHAVSLSPVNHLHVCQPDMFLHPCTKYYCHQLLVIVMLLHVACSCAGVLLETCYHQLKTLAQTIYMYSVFYLLFQ